MYEDAGRHKFKVAWATSSGSPYRLRPTLRLAKVALSFSLIAAVMLVLIGPGQMQLTVIPLGPSSKASDLVKPITPCLAAVYGL